MLLGGPECGSQGFPAFTMAGLVVGVGVLGCEAGCAGGGFCAAAELVVDELGAVVFAGQAAFMGVVVGEGLSGLVDEQSQGLDELVHQDRPGGCVNDRYFDDATV